MTEHIVSLCQGLRARSRICSLWFQPRQNGISTWNQCLTLTLTVLNQSHACLIIKNVRFIIHVWRNGDEHRTLTHLISSSSLGVSSSNITKSQKPNPTKSTNIVVTSSDHFRFHKVSESSHPPNMKHPTILIRWSQWNVEIPYTFLPWFLRGCLILVPVIHLVMLGIPIVDG